MFESVAAFVERKIKPQRETPDDDHIMHLATAVLLLEVSRADFDVQEEELRTIVSALAERFRFPNRRFRVWWIWRSPSRSIMSRSIHS